MSDDRDVILTVGSSVGEDSRGKFLTEAAPDFTEVMFVPEYTMTGAIWSCATCANWGRLVAVRNPAEARAHCEEAHGYPTVTRRPAFPPAG